MKHSLNALLIFMVTFILSSCANTVSLTDGDFAQSEQDASESNLSDGDSLTDGDTDFIDSEFVESDGDTEDVEIELEAEIERITLTLIDGCNPFATSDECVLPFPSSFYEITDETSSTGFRGNYPDDMLPDKDGETFFDISSANAADGCSPASPILLHFEVDVDESFLTTQHEIGESLNANNSMALFNLETGERVLFMSEMDQNRSSKYEDRYAMIIRPLEPMEMGGRHVVVLTDKITDASGKHFKSPKAFAALRDGVYTTNEEIENVREKYEDIFDFLDTNGYPRDELFLAWDFGVASQDFLLGSMLSMRKEALKQVENDELTYTITKVTDDFDANIAKMIEGDFEVPTYLNEDNTFDYDSDHLPVLQDTNQTFPFTMAIPRKAVTSDEPLPLLVFGHGIFGEGRNYLTAGWSVIVRELANSVGAIVIATDWIGLSGGDQNLIITELISDLNRIGLVTDRLQQALVNNLVMTELALGDLNTDPQIQVNDHQLIDTDRVYYYGISLGGIMGSSLMSLSNKIERGVLAVPGSVWSNMLPRSSVWPTIELVFNSQYPDPLVRQIGIAFMQARFDNSDPVNMTKLLFKAPLDDAPENRAVLLQEAIGDSQVPNLTTEMLARCMGIKALTPNINSPFDLETVSAPTTESVLTQYYLKEQVLENPPPDTNVPPRTGNGAHADMAHLPHVQQQLSEFLLGGTINLYCDGACDPD